MVDPNLAERVDEARLRYEGAWRSVAAIVNHLRIRQQQLAVVLGLDNQRVSERLNGRRRIQGWEMDAFAIILEVPPAVLRMAPDEAVRWVIDNPQARPHGLTGQMSTRGDDARSPP